MTALARAEDAGWPRERLPAELIEYDARSGIEQTTTRMLPSIFAGGATQRKGDWLTFDEGNLRRCKVENACVVCGLTLGRVVVFGATGAWESNGPAAHPRCFALTLKFCPHFTRHPFTRKRQTCAYVYTGDDWREAVRLWYEPEHVTRERQQDETGGTFPLHRRKVRAHDRAACIALAKADPMGEGNRPAVA